MVWFIVDVVTSGYNIATRWMLVKSSSGCFIPDNVSFETCAMVDVLVPWSILKDVGKKASSFFRILFQCV